MCIPFEGTLRNIHNNDPKHLPLCLSLSCTSLFPSFPPSSLFFLFYLSFVCFETQLRLVSNLEDNLDLPVLLPPPPKCWDNRPMPPCPTKTFPYLMRNSLYTISELTPEYSKSKSPSFQVIILAVP